MLRHLMEVLRRERGFTEEEKLEPWQEFDMIGGTSTGGLLAIMLGRLRMSVDECESAYLHMSKTIFTRSRATANYLGRAYDFLQAGAKFQAQPLEDSIKNAIRDAGLKEEELLWEKDIAESCRV